MIYTDFTRKAIKFAFKAHEGQVDRSGIPYILHPVHVAEKMLTEDTCVAAILHDVLEDTDITEEDLRREGFTGTQIEAVVKMTRKPDEDYKKKKREIKKNPIATEVKKADLMHNMDTSRLEKITSEDEERYKKYKKALDILEE